MSLSIARSKRNSEPWAMSSSCSRSGGLPGVTADSCPPSAPTSMRQTGRLKSQGARTLGDFIAVARRSRVIVMSEGIFGLICQEVLIF